MVWVKVLQLFNLCSNWNVLTGTVNTRLGISKYVFTVWIESFMLMFLRSGLQNRVSILL